MTGAEWHAIGFTCAACMLSTLCILPLGVGLGWLLARAAFAGKAVLETALALPLVLPPVATGIVLLRLLGRHGPIGAILDRWLGVEIAFTWRAVVIAAAVMSFPLLLRAVRVAFEEVDQRLEGVARTLGASNARVFWTITLPLARRGVLAGVVLAFARALGEFGATMLVAGNIPGETATVSLSIYRAVQLGDDASALRLVGVSAVLAFAALWTGERMLRAPRERR